MPISSVQPAYQLIERSTQMANEATREINERANVSPANPANENTSLEFNKVEFKAPDTSQIEPIIKLSQSSQYSQIGSNMLQRDQEMLGSLLDIHI